MGPEGSPENKEHEGPNPNVDESWARPEERLVRLPPKERAIERARLVGNMQLVEIGERGYEPVPIHFVGSSEEATALLDIVQGNFPPERFGVVILSNVPRMAADPALTRRMKNGCIQVDQRDGETALLYVTRDEGTDRHHCRFGCSSKGGRIIRTSGRPGEPGRIHMDTPRDPRSVVPESLVKLYRLTGNPAFMDALAEKIEAGATRGAGKVTAERTDPRGYYAALGLNPHASKFVPQDVLDGVIKGARREVAKELHPDANPSGVSEEQKERLNRVIIAADALDNEEKRKRYS